MLDRAAIAARIPHQGNMCLLDTVVEWSPERIHCRASSHRALDNPLRSEGRLGAACGIEYAAQAMAVHGALLGEQAEQGFTRPRQGYLASVRAVEMQVTQLDDIAKDLELIAERLFGDDNNVLYQFTVHSEARLLLSGRAAVILDTGKP